MKTRNVLALVIVLLCAVGFCLAASQNATVTGGVYDSTGKPLGGVRVVLENPALGFERDATTADDGSYTFTQVPPQDGYRLAAYRDTAMIALRTALTIAVGEDKSILPPLREEPPAAAHAAEVKEVQAEALSNETISTSLSGVISGDQLRHLPLFNRNFLALGLLTPNTHDTEAGSPLTGATFSIAGSRPNTNMFLLDGTDNVAHSSNQAIPFQVNDSVQEFRVISSAASAEYGGGSGGVINVVTRRASNGFHGSGFGYFSDGALNAENPLSVYNGSGFDKSAAYAGKPIPDLVNEAPTSYNSYVATANVFGWCTDSIGGATATDKKACKNTGGFGKNTLFDPASILAQHDTHAQPFSARQFGLNMGGAVVKDKLFVFGSYEGTRIDNPNPIFERVPSTFDKTYNPLLAAGLPSATPYFFSATNKNYVMAQKVLALYPSANVVGVPGVLEFYQGQAPNYTDVDNGLLRADWVQNKATNWSFRYSAQNLGQLHDDTLPLQSTYRGNGAYRDAFNQNITLTNTHAFNSRVTMESRLGFTRFRVNELPQDGSFNASALGMPTSQMMTVNLAGLDPQYSGATRKGTGAFAPWIDSYWLLPYSNACSADNLSACVPPGFPGVDLFDQLPTLAGQFAMARLGAPLSAPGQHRDSTWLFDDNVSWVKGRHTLKLGGGYRYYQDRVFSGGFTRGTMVASNIGSFTSDSMSSIFASVFGGLSAFTTPSFDYAVRQPNPYLGRFGSHAFGLFVQDSWRLNPRLSANLGLRYDYFSTPQEANNNAWNFDPAANGLVKIGDNKVFDPFNSPCTKSGKAVPDASIYPAAQYIYGWGCSPTGEGRMPHAKPYNFGPRAGLAWDVFGNGSTVLRGGAALLWDQQPTSYAEQLIYNRPSPLDLTNPSLIYGQQFFQYYLSPLDGKYHYSCLQCGLGNTSVNPGYFSNPAGQNVVNSSFPNINQLQAASSPFGVSALDTQNSASPYTTQFNVGVQQRLNNHMAVELAYIQTHGDLLPVVANRGFNNEWFCTANPPKRDSDGNIVTPGCDGVSPVFSLSNQASSMYHSFMARVRAADIHGLTLNATYTYSTSHDNASSANFPLIPVTLTNEIFGIQNLALGVPFVASGAGNGGGAGTRGLSLGADVLGQALTTTGASQALVSRYTIPQDPNNFLKDDYGRSDFDMTHRLVFDYLWDVPLLRHASRTASNWFGNWRLSGTLVAQSGQPYTVFAGPIGGELMQRADILSLPTVHSNDPNHYLEPDVFALASKEPECSSNYGAAEFGTVGFQLFNGVVGKPCLGTSHRNQFTGPNFIQMNFAVQKGIQVAEGKAFTIRAEFYNLFNRQNFYNPISALSVDGGTFNPDFGKIKSAHEPFQVQLAARFTW